LLDHIEKASGAIKNGVTSIKQNHSVKAPAIHFTEKKRTEENNKKKKNTQETMCEKGQAMEQGCSQKSEMVEIVLVLSFGTFKFLSGVKCFYFGGGQIEGEREE